MRAYDLMSGFHKGFKCIMYKYDPNTHTIWLLHESDEKSQCPGLALYLEAHFKMLGLGGGPRVYCRAKADGTYVGLAQGEGEWRPLSPAEYPDCIRERHNAHRPIEGLAHWDSKKRPNTYEATLFFNSKYYALGEGIYASAEAVVKGIFGDNIRWAYSNSGGVFNNPCDYKRWREVQ